MIRATACMVALLLTAACTGRHFVVERDVGRIDGEKSIASQSDTDWTVVRGPAAQAGEKPEAGEGP